MYNDIRLEKGLYNLSGKSFLQALEAADPTENYEGTPLGNLDAFERQLKRFDIKISGENCDRVEKFFVTTESAVLFPEFVRRAVTAGMEESVLPELIAVKTVCDSTQYSGCTVTETPAYTTVTAQGAALPETSVKEAASALTLSKFGRLITASYEAVRMQKLDVFAVTLRAIGKKLADAMVKNAVSVLKTGADKKTISGDSLAFSDITSLFGSFNSYDMTAMIASPKNIAAIISMSQFSEALTTDERGNIVLPFGTRLIKSSQIDDDTIIGIDSRYALEFVTSSELIMESDKLIDRQLDAFTVSCSLAFRKLMSDAVITLSLSNQ